MQLEFNIPAPAETRRGRPPKYYPAAMTVNSSFVADTSYSSISTTLKRFTDQPEFANWKFRIKTIGTKQCRVWRVK